jgi:hypothetical protein
MAFLGKDCCPGHSTAASIDPIGRISTEEAPLYVINAKAAHHEANGCQDEQVDNDQDGPEEKV